MATYQSAYTGVEIDAAIGSIKTGTVNPIATTVGGLGQIYRNTENGLLFRCAKVEGQVYTWKMMNETSADLIKYDDEKNIKEVVDDLKNSKADNSRIDEILITPAEGVSEQEIIDARDGEETLGVKVRSLGQQINSLAEQLEDGTAGIDDAIVSTDKVWSSAKTQEQLNNILNLPTVPYVSVAQPPNLQEGDIWFEIVTTELPVADYLFRFDASELNLADGAKVSSWADLSGKGNTVVQGAEASKPTFLVDGINGKHAVQFNNSFMDKSGFALDDTGEYTMFVIGQFIDSTPSTTLMSIGEISTNLARSLSIRKSSNALSYIWLNEAVRSTGHAMDDNPYLFTSTYDGATVEIYDKEIVTGSTAYTGNIGNHNRLRIGQNMNPGGLEPYNGKFAEIVYFSRKLNETEFNAMQSHLLAKWGFV